MKTKRQKTEELNLGTDLLDKNQSFIFADFNKVNVDSIEKLKTELKKSGAIFKVMKKRLFKIALKQKGIDFDPTQFNSQLGVIFSKDDLTNSAGAIYKFSRELTKAGKEFKVLGAYEAETKNLLDAEQFLVIAKLPSKEVLLAQIVGTISGPLRAFMYIVQELSKKTEVKPEAEDKPESKSKPETEVKSEESQEQATKQDDEQKTVEEESNK
jgi:large subunit ribosomal protein L10